MAWLKTRDIKDGVVTNVKLGDKLLHAKKFSYSFAVAGGGTGAYTLTDDAGNAQTLPESAVIISATSEVVIGVTSGGSATIKFGVLGDDDMFLALTAKGSFDAASKCVKMEASLPQKITATKAVVMTVAVAALTAGQLNVGVRYYEGD